ncbi:MAG: hypothetical protein WD876_00125 [Candidatus Pacearchaeota archaeon]
MIKKMGGNQRASRKAKLEMLAQNGVFAEISFKLENGENINLRSKLENRGGYWMTGYNIHLPIKDVRFNGHYTSLTVDVQKGSRVEEQLKYLRYIQ